jgi:addiction module RelB/DinJ family antitoxin
MNNASILIKTDPEVKEEAQKTARELGLSLSSVVTRLLKEFVKTKAITFSSLDETPNQYFINAIKEARENRKQGKASPIFTDDAELIKKTQKSTDTPIPCRNGFVNREYDNSI